MAARLGAWVPGPQAWPGPDPGTTVRAPVVAGRSTAVRAAAVIGAVVLLLVLVGTVHTLWPQPEDTTPSTSSRPEPQAAEQQVDAPASTAPSPAGGANSRLDAAAVCEKVKALARTEERAGIEKFCSEGLPALEAKYPAAVEKFAGCIDDAANSDDLIRCTSKLPGFIEEAKEASKPKPDDWKARMKDVWNRCDDYHAELYAAKVAYARDIRDGQCEGGGACAGRDKLYEFNATAHKRMAPSRRTLARSWTRWPRRTCRWRCAGRWSEGWTRTARALGATRGARFSPRPPWSKTGLRPCARGQT